jgi:hypothetical protein
LLGIRFEHIDTEGQFSIIMDVDADGNYLRAADFPNAFFTAPATLTLDKLRDRDEGEVRCTIYTTSGGPMSDSVSLNIVPIVPVDGEFNEFTRHNFEYICNRTLFISDQIKFKITLKVSDNEVECGQQTFIDFDEIITIEVSVESNSGAPMEVNAFKKCEEGDETPIGTKCIKESDVCRFETSAGCVGFTKGLVTIRATVQHPALDEAKELTCSYIVQGEFVLKMWCALVFDFELLIENMSSETQETL